MHIHALRYEDKFSIQLFKTQHSQRTVLNTNMQYMQKMHIKSLNK